jgi:hypothetical protein
MPPLIASRVVPGQKDYVVQTEQVAAQGATAACARSLGNCCGMKEADAIRRAGWRRVTRRPESIGGLRTFGANPPYALPRSLQKLRADLRAVPPPDLGGSAGAGIARRQKRECLGNRLRGRDEDPHAGIGKINDPAGTNCKADANPSIRTHAPSGGLPLIARLSAHTKFVAQRMPEV